MGRKMVQLIDRYDYAKLQERCHWLVKKAVQQGYLQPAKECRCADCNEPADCYDHRSYVRPLDVDAVCRGCNIRRGSAIEIKAYMIPSKG